MTTYHITNPPMEGCAALEKALHAAKLLNEAQVDNKYTSADAEAAYWAKWRLGYPVGQLHRHTEYAGQRLLDYLTGKEELPTQYQARRRDRLGLKKVEPSHPVHQPSERERHADAMRKALVAEYEWLIAREPEIHYSQVRPIPEKIPVRTIPPGGITTDCSGLVEICCKWAKIPDPSGERYNGLGYTGTLLSHLHHIEKAQVKPGDLIVFGRNTGNHVVMVLDTTNPDFTIGSHGQEKGPIKLQLSVEAEWQANAHKDNTIVYLQMQFV